MLRTKITPEILTDQPDADIRITTTGAVFTRDRSHAELNEAWRDPDGLIWGDVARRANGTVHYMNHSDATNYCASIGARLPSMEQFSRLREYMRDPSDQRYHAQVLPNLLGHRFLLFWDRSDSISDHYLFNGNDGEFYYNDRIDIATRCVADGLGLELTLL